MSVSIYKTESFHKDPRRGLISEINYTENYILIKIIDHNNIYGMILTKNQTTFELGQNTFPEKRTNR